MTVRERMEILESLNRGELSADRAVSLLRQGGKQQKEQYPYRERQSGEWAVADRKDDRKKRIILRRGHWFKIHVRDEDHNLRFYLPISLLNFGFFLGKKVVGRQYLKDKDNEGMRTARNVLHQISGRDMRSLTRVMRESGNTNLVEVANGDTFVNIRIV